MTDTVFFERRGKYLRFKLPRWISREDYQWITGIQDVWYYGENKYFYLKPQMRPAVERILTELGFTIEQDRSAAAAPTPTTEPTQNDNGYQSSSEVIESGIRIVSKISRLFKVKTRRVCGKCDKTVRWDRSYRMFHCPEHGFHYAKKVWYFTGLLDINGEEQLVLLYDNCFTGLLRKIGMRKRDIEDAVKGLSKELYFEQLRQIKERVADRLEELNREYGFFGDMIEWKIDGNTVVFFKATKTMTERELKTLKGAEKFIAGEFETIKQLAEEILPDYDLTVKSFGDAPIVLLRKEVGDDVIEIIIRAPVGEYGKAYHLSVKINEVRMFPTAPVTVSVWGHSHKIWAWRVFHTKGWEENIRERLEYLKKMENRGLVITHQAKQIRNFVGGTLLSDLNLPDKTKKAIIDQWEDGNTLMEFCTLIAKYNPTEALQALQNAVKILYKTTYGRWLLQETDMTDEDIAEITLTSKRVTQNA